MGHAGETCTGSPPSAQPCEVEGTHLGMPAQDTLKSRQLPRWDLSLRPAWDLRTVGDVTPVGPGWALTLVTLEALTLVIG